ncbi:hypothetical protein A2716_02845 [candidate division WWE3 bacterium RIFCSPHIGHO2_01_FULL_40_23]|uniref:Uncharacterized protein n=1 Tax=candidate division WWE3 bacterium RIFCSPLOWO2_01_FULL_41_18 TaxID=1802625 RepID=A0A1F4VGR6_UNCKA|nr:MAG: hypothetical protein A2716_02845 [candidate division WWE3 bacterium RIFCSPHIGHO2_01_FULL_40_23]OGC55923.1 MAG: hypothetical protein A3A78_02695 [candidate division WWE3 bacterium RIFCSPLOWO2_01_FULL_41_18]
MSQKVNYSTQDHLDIETITDDLVVLKNGGVTLVLKTTAVNFDLLSEIEQDAIIAAFSALLNSLSFPIQVILRSKRLDITNYIEKVKAVESKIKDPLLRIQAQSYRKFVQDLIQRNEVLDKSFYVAIPSGGTVDVPRQQGGGPFDFISLLTGSRNKRMTVNVPHVIKNATAELYPKRDNIVKEFARIGIKTRQLNTQELVELFFDIYNPSSVHEQRIKARVDDFKVAIVEPAILEE